MKKIMFNDFYGLTDAVLNGKKTMTRRMVKDGTPLGNWGETEKYAKYKIGEEVAVAQCYSDIHWDCREEWHKKGINLNVQRDGTLKGLVELKGWDNKMFVRADAMPHHIRITDIKVERLQDISEEDCLREGVHYYNCGIDSGYTFNRARQKFGTASKAFAALIDKVSGKGTWENNPWVFAYTFELIK